MDEPPGIVPSEHWTSRVPLWLGAGGNVANFLASIRFYFVPFGMHIRSMGIAALLWYFSALAFVALLLVLPDLRRRPKCFRSWLTVVLALTPMPLASVMVQHAAKMRGFFLAP